MAQTEGGPLSETEDPTTAGLETPAPQSNPVTEQAPVPATPRGTQGPIGKPRGIGFVIVLSIVTLGIYHLYWIFKNFAEMKDHTGRGIGGVLGLVFAIIINPVNWFVMPSEVGKMYRSDGRIAPMTGWTGLWMILPIVGWFVWTIKIQGALNRYWETKAATA
jgi:hypothetical protein